MCEGDDFWVDPMKLQIQFDFLENNPDYVISGHDAFIIDESGNRLKDSKLPDSQKRDFSSEELILGKAWLLTMSWVYRNVAKEYAPERTMVTNGDTFFVSLIGEYGKSKYHPEIQPAAYRAHADGIWSLLSEHEKIDSHINTWYWMYRYYLRQEKTEYAQHYWNKFIITIYSKLCSAKELELASFPSGVSTFYDAHPPSEIESVLENQSELIKQLNTHSKSLEKSMADFKNSLSYRLGHSLLWPLKAIFRR